MDDEQKDQDMIDNNDPIDQAPGRLCYDCKHCLCSYEPDWSDLTPGSGLELECVKGHWSFGDDLSRTDLRKAMRTAATCADFEQGEP